MKKMLLVLVLLLMMPLSQRAWHGRLDMTADHRYTLSPSTIAALSSLSDTIRIRADFTEGLPAQFARLRTQAVDLLEEFRARSGGRLVLEYADPSADSSLRADVLEAGLREVQVAERTRGGAVARRGFFGLELRAGPELEVIPLVENIESLEYELMLRVRRLSSGPAALGVIEGMGAGKVFLLEPGDAPVPRSGFASVFPSLAAELDRGYALVGLDGVSAIPDSIGTILVAAPRTLDTACLARLEAWFALGRNLVVMAPALELSLGAEDVEARYTSPAAAPLLLRYGITVDSQMVLDRRHGAAFFGDSPYGVPYPPFLEIREDGLDAGHEATAGLGSLLIPWTASLDTLPVPGSLYVKALLTSSSEAWRMGAPFDLRPKDPNLGEFWLASTPGRRLLALERGLRMQGGTSRLLVVSNSLFLTDFFVAWSVQGGETGGMENLSFMLNAIDHLAADSSFGRLRAKRLENRPLSEAADRGRYAWMAFNLAFAPLLFSLLGLGWAAWRRRRNKRLYQGFRADSPS